MFGKGSSVPVGPFDDVPECGVLPVGVELVVVEIIDELEVEEVCKDVVVDFTVDGVVDDTVDGTV